jgi:multicomponent Na+:H+ antiporter subunit F
MFLAGIAALLVALTLMVIRALRGPTTFDRLVASNAIATAVILLVALYGFFIDRPDFLDIAILYALLNAVGTFAVLKFWRHGSLGHAGEEEEEAK